MNDTDKKILKILQKNARATFTEIAKQLNLSEAAVRKRIKKLEEEGIIKCYLTNLNYSSIGKIASILGIDTTSEDYVNVISQLKELKRKNNNIIELYTSTGDHMIMMKVVFDNQEELKKFIQEIEKIKGVTKICPSIIVETL
ncbi:MAG TPA: winged helix-turn-helix transcriptional regulator [Nautiliaceae bacterium]|nr:winged helix-turn-helix transcriptional regulator [Nautiliaceae bacterium]